MRAPNSTLDLLSRLWLREPDSEALAAAREVPSLAPHAGEPDTMAAAYADLFLLNVYPYGTTFTDTSGELCGPAAGWAARRYEDRGFRPPELLEVGAPDHVGLCLAFLDHLAARGERDAEFCSFVLEWVPICCLAVEREPAGHPFYKSLATVTRKRLMEEGPESPPQEPDAPSFSLSSRAGSLSSRAERGIPGHAEESTDPEDEEVGLSQVLRYLLAPARSGLFLSRAKLGQLAREAGMRLPFGSRFDVARLLFQTAGESGKVGLVLDLVEAELAVWEAAYRAWAEEHPRWKPFADGWLSRTEETRRMLGEMREILQNPPELEYADGRSAEDSP